jgi:hypothetical protein
MVHRIIALKMKPVRAQIRQSGFLLVRRSLRWAGIREPRVVFIMGHMRSGSTLMMHILISNPGLIGCGERGVPYRSADDLDKLEIASRRMQRSLLRQVLYVVDQINHDHLTPDPGLFQLERLRFIFLIRDPEETIRSLIHLSKSSPQPWSVEKAVDYYVTRLNSLAKFSKDLGNRSIALTYSDLVDRPPATLQRIGSFLSLPSELREEYTLQPFTGRRGDRSERIRLGRIMRMNPQTSLRLSDYQRQRADEAFRTCLANLRLTF